MGASLIGEVLRLSNLCWQQVHK